MGLQVVGAGVGRTGTLSLKLALERLLGAPCYHMLEVFMHPEHVPVWTAAGRGEPVDWDSLLDGYVACVDWPGGSFWRELSDAYPEALILHSTRSSADAWWTSADATIFRGFRDEPDPNDENGMRWREMWHEMASRRFPGDLTDEAQAKAAYEAHNADVLANADRSRFLAWQPGDGWEPLCTALGVDVPDEPFPHVNTTEEFAARWKRD